MSFYNKGALEDDDIKLMFAFQKGDKKPPHLVRRFQKLYYWRSILYYPFTHSLVFGSNL
jgi:hypothetical protein